MANSPKPQNGEPFGLICPACGADQNHVTDCRPNVIGFRRRRRCYACNGRFTTYEVVVDGDAPLVIRGGRTSRPTLESLSPYLRRLETELVSGIGSHIDRFFVGIIRKED